MPDGMKLPDYWYTPYFGKYASGQEMKLLRQEYTRLRDITNKRISRLQAAGLPVRDFKKGVPRLRDIRENQAQFAHTLSDLYNFVKNPATLVGGARASRDAMIESLHEAGYDFINESNLYLWGSFHELLRLSGLEALPEFKYKKMVEAFTKITSDINVESSKRAQRRKLEKAFRAYVKEEFDFEFRFKKGERRKWLK